MKLVTRIVSFEWFAVCLIACVCAFSIKLLSESSSQHVNLGKMHSKQRKQLSQFSATLNHFAITEARTRLQQAGSEELSAAKEKLKKQLINLPKISTSADVLTPLQKTILSTREYLEKKETLEAVVKGLQITSQALETNQQAEISKASEPADSGITLISIVGAVVILISLVLSAQSSRNIGQPLETLHRTVLDLIEPQNAHRRVPDGPYDPNLRELGKAINKLAQRLENAERAAANPDTLMLTAASFVTEHLEAAWVITDLSGRPCLSNAAARELLNAYSDEQLAIKKRIQSVDNADLGNNPSDISVLADSTGTRVGFAMSLHAPKSV